jgi:glyoxylase-like metal-dependent hydrolase (beta-lactamase superfamily II)
MAEDIYEVFAIKYARHSRRSPENFIGGDEHDTDMPLDYFVWVVRNGDRTILVDMGFGAEVGSKRGRQIIRPVAEGLQALGIPPSKVEDLIITHLHYDHAGNHALFPNARYHLQDREMEFASGRCMCHSVLNHAYEANDVMQMVRCVFEKRVHFHDGSDEIARGIEVHHIGGHTKGLQAVRVRTRRGWVVLASDASHFYAHMEQDRVFPIAYTTCWPVTTLCGGWQLPPITSCPAMIRWSWTVTRARNPAPRTGSSGWMSTPPASCLWS